MSSRWAHRLAESISAVVLVAALILALLMVGPALLGYHRYVITSGSMEPVLRVGSIVYSREVPAEHLRVGDIITFVPPREFGISEHITHRIVAIHRNVLQSDGRRITVYRTKGDDNPALDPWHIGLNDRNAAVVAHHIQYLGYAYLVLSKRWVQIGLVGVPAILIAIGLGFLLWHTAGQAVREQRDKDAEAAPQRESESSEAVRS